MKRDPKISRRQFLFASSAPVAAMLGGCKEDDGAAMKAEIQRATESVNQALAKAESDPARPEYHFRPPAQWMNDPNGPIHYGGFYHVFYQHNPFEDRWGHMYWGHTRSRDLVNWEHRPIALAPSYEKGETHCFSGCARVNGAGKPMFFYTSVGKEGARGKNTRPFEQWAAIGSEDLDTWKSHPKNPILALATHGGPDFGEEWRDPFLFDADGKTYMVIGARLADEAVVALYEADDDSLESWTYRDIIYRQPTSESEFLECPNFVPLGDQWILIYAPYRVLEYVVGDFDGETASFEPTANGILDPGSSNTAHYYASNIFFDSRGRCILLGWIRGFPEEKGWNGCLALPRLLKAGPDGRPIQQPIPELKKLRGSYRGFAGTRPQSDPLVLQENASQSAEWLMDLSVSGESNAGIRLTGPDGEDHVSISYGDGILTVGDQELPYSLETGAESIRLHAFLDRSTLEVFVDDGKLAVTTLFTYSDEPVRLEVFGDTAAIFQNLDVWDLKPIWPKMAG